MSVFSEYVKEREGKEVIETDRGFAIYSIVGTECYISDIYVRPEFRKTGAASAFADEICKIGRDAGCSILTGSVNPKLQSATTSLRVLLGYGMRLHSASSDGLIFIKEL